MPKHGLFLKALNIGGSFSKASKLGDTPKYSNPLRNHVGASVPDHEWDGNGKRMNQFLLREYSSSNDGASDDLLNAHQRLNQPHRGVSSRLKEFRGDPDHEVIEHLIDTGHRFIPKQKRAGSIFSDPAKISGPTGNYDSRHFGNIGMRYAQHLSKVADARGKEELSNLRQRYPYARMRKSLRLSGKSTLSSPDRKLILSVHRLLTKSVNEDPAALLRSFHDYHSQKVPEANRDAWHKQANALADAASKSHAAMLQAESKHGQYSDQHLAAKAARAHAIGDHAAHMLGIPRPAEGGEPDPFGSIKKHSTNGAYTPEREATHHKITSHFMDAYKSHPQGAVDKAEMMENPQAVFMMGGSGSGKGFQKNKHYGHHPSFVNIDPDEMKAHLAKADHLPGMHNYLPGHWHEESSELAKKLQHRANKEKRSYIFDTVGGNPDSLIKKAKLSEGTHQLHLRHVDVPRETAWQRNLSRDRTVPKDVFNRAHDDVLKAKEPASKYFLGTRNGTVETWN